MTGVVFATDDSPLSRVLPEATLVDVVDLFVRLVEGAAALVVFTGAVIAFARISVAVVRRSDESAFVPIRFDLGRFLLVGLEFQLAADVLKTSVAPTFAEIGQLAAIAAIRTVLSYFLNREVAWQREELARDRPAADAGPGDGDGYGPVVGDGLKPADGDRSRPDGVDRSYPGDDAPRQG